MIPVPVGFFHKVDDEPPPDEAAATIVQTDTKTNDANAATYNYTTANGNALAIGADGGNDVIYIGAGARTTENASTATVTVDGVTADPVVQHNFNEGGGIRSLAGIWAIDRNDLPDPSQTDIDVVVEYNTGCLRSNVAAAVSPDAVKAATDTATQDAGSAGNLNVNTTAGGVVMGYAHHGGSGTFNWSGATKETDAEIEGNRYTSAYASNVSAETPRSVDVSTSDTDLSASVAASFAAAVDPAVATLTDTDETGSAGSGGHTFNNVDIGSIGNAVIVIVSGFNASVPVTGLTIAGNPATYLGDRATTADTGVEMWGAFVSETGAQSIAVAYTGTPTSGRFAISVYRVENLVSLTPVDTHSEGPPTDGNKVVSTADGGCVIAGAIAWSDPTYVWGGFVTEDHETLVAGTTDHTAASGNGATGANVTVEFTVNGENSNSALLIASLR